MIDSKHGEEESPQETQAGEAGGGAYSLQRGAKKGLGGWKKEEIVRAVSEILTEEFCEDVCYENRVIYKTEAIMLAKLVCDRLKTF